MVADRHIEIRQLSNGSSDRRDICQDDALVYSESYQKFKINCWNWSKSKTAEIRRTFGLSDAKKSTEDVFKLTRFWKKLISHFGLELKIPPLLRTHGHKIVVRIVKVVKITNIYIDKIALDIFYPHTKFGECRFNRSGYIIVGVENEKMGHVTLTTSF